MQIEISETAGVRYLHFGSDWIQGAMRIARPWALELDYTREMMAALLLRPEPDWPRSVLLIGLGAGSLTKFLHRHRPDARLHVVEIEPAVLAVARQYFKLPDEDRRLCVTIQDGAEFVEKSKKTYDLILVDGYDADARTGDLDTIPFYLNAKRCLRDGGLLVANLFARRKSFVGSMARLNEAFDGRTMAFPPCGSGNVAAFATAGPTLELSLPDLKERALALKGDTGLNLVPTVDRLTLASSSSIGMLRL